MICASVNHLYICKGELEDFESMNALNLKVRRKIHKLMNEKWKQDGRE